MRTRIPFALLATALACTLASTAAHARARVFVASYGNDANPCTFGSPCKTFQQAVNVVDVSGEVTAIDSAGFGPITITQAVTITSPPGVEAGIVPTSGNPAINITAMALSGVIQLRGLTLDGTGGGTNGIVYSGGGLRVEIIDCLIHNFSNDGILLAPANFHTPNNATIANNVASNNGAFGIEISPATPFFERGTIDHVTTNANGQSGILINGANTVAFADFAISNSVSDSNASNGIFVQGNNNVKVEVRDSTLSNNLSSGLSVSNAKVGIYANSIVLNQFGFSITNSGTIFSFGNNVIENNASAGTGSLTPATAQ
jgi:hypothetical protein